MFVNQLSVFIENREGRLDKVLATLKDNDINKKILAYKLCFDYDNDLICKILNLPKNVYKEK